MNNLLNPERASRPSQAQLEVLIEFLVANPKLAKGFAKMTSARDADRKKWEVMAHRLNNIGGCVKTWKQWTKYWADKKSAVKKKSALRASLMNTSDGTEVIEFTEMEEKILALSQSVMSGRQSHHITNNSNENLQSNDDSRDSSSTNVGEINVPLAFDTDNFSESEDKSYYTSEKPGFIQMVSSEAILQCTPESESTPSGSGGHPSRSPKEDPEGLVPSDSQNPLQNINTRSRSLRHHRSSSHKSHRMNHYSRITERLLAIEEQRLALDQRNSHLLEILSNVVERVMSRDTEKDRTMSQALATVGDSLKLLTEVIGKKL